MRKTRLVLILGVLHGFLDSSFGIVWVGESSITGQVTRPATYQQVVSHLLLSRFTFDNYQSGVVLNNMDLGGVIPSASPGGIFLSIDPNGTAGAEAASPPNVVHVDESLSKPTRLRFVIDEPVKVMGFVLGGLGSQSYLYVYDEDSDLVGSYRIPAALSTKRRWVAVMEDDCYISKVELEPDLIESYAIDDLELAHTPEPGSLVLFMFMSCMLRGRIRRVW
ncbi:MAG: hypothetical protein ACYTF1_10895 [Planctomycetota bacterium]|jgi:hypothetical protein